MQSRETKTIFIARFLYYLQMRTFTWIILVDKIIYNYIRIYSLLKRTSTFMLILSCMLSALFLNHLQGWLQIHQADSNTNMNTIQIQNQIVSSTFFNSNTPFQIQIKYKYNYICVLLDNEFRHVIFDLFACCI